MAPSELMTMWPVTARVNSYGLDEPSLLDKVMAAVERGEHLSE
jgi:hypothetical protein